MASAASSGPAPRAARAPTARTGLGNIETLGGAFATLRGQIEAHLQGEPPSAELLRTRVLMLLTPPLQRDLFLWTAGRGAAGLRACQALFGAPPYAFLGPMDAAALSARGFAPGRARMIYEAASAAAPNYAQFGSAHYEDQEGRQLRFMQDPRSGPDAPTSVLALEGGSTHAQFALRLPRKRASPSSVRGEQPRAGFPSPNARLRLRLQPALRVALGTRADAVGEVEIRVLDIQSASLLRGRPVARDAVALLRAELLDVRPVDRSSTSGRGEPRSA